MASKKVIPIDVDAGGVQRIGALTGAEYMAFTQAGNSRVGQVDDVKGYIMAGNLAGLASPSAARTNLGLGSAATFASSAFLQTANNLSDLGNVGTARTNLSVYSKAEVDAAIAAAAGGGPWYKGHFPTVAILSTLIKSNTAPVNIALTDDADIGLLCSSVDLTSGETWRLACQLTPADTASWAATCHLLPGILASTTSGFGLYLIEVNTGNPSFPLVQSWGPWFGGGVSFQLRRSFPGSFVANDLSLGIIDPDVAVWLRIRWDLPTLKYYYDYSYDGKQWSNASSMSKASIGFINGANHIGLGFFGNSGVAGQKITGVCDYWVVG